MTAPLVGQAELLRRLDCAFAGVLGVCSADCVWGP